MMSQLMWIPPKFGQVSNLMWIIFGWTMKLSDLCGFYDVYSNDRKTPKDCPDIFYNTDLAPKPEYTAVPASLILIVCADGRTDGRTTRNLYA